LRWVVRAWPRLGPLQVLRRMADSVTDLSPTGPLRGSWRDRWQGAWRGLRPGRPAWWPARSVPAAMRAVRATLAMPALFALTSEAIGNPGDDGAPGAGGGGGGFYERVSAQVGPAGAGDHRARREGRRTAATTVVAVDHRATEVRVAGRFQEIFGAGI